MIINLNEKKFTYSKAFYSYSSNSSDLMTQPHTIAHAPWKVIKIYQFDNVIKAKNG
jgi:hypothetical protein